MSVPPPPTKLPKPLAADLAAFNHRLLGQGLHPALQLLNGRTAHRFTGVFRFDGETLRNVALVDKWEPAVERGEDVPLASAYCAHLHRTGQPLEVVHGPTDARVPGMEDSSVLSYCGAVILGADGLPWGALCHFDSDRCESKNSELPLLVAAAALLYQPASSHA